MLAAGEFLSVVSFISSSQAAASRDAKSHFLGKRIQSSTDERESNSTLSMIKYIYIYISDLVLEFCKGGGVGVSSSTGSRLLLGGPRGRRRDAEVGEGCAGGVGGHGELSNSLHAVGGGGGSC